MHRNPFKAVIAGPNEDLLHGRRRVEDARQVGAPVEAEIEAPELAAAATSQLCRPAGPQIVFAPSQQFIANYLFRRMWHHDDQQG